MSHTDLFKMVFIHPDQLHRQTQQNKKNIFIWGRAKNEEKMLFLGIESDCSLSGRLNLLGNASRNFKWIKVYSFLSLFRYDKKDIVLQYG